MNFKTIEKPNKALAYTHAKNIAFSKLSNGLLNLSKYLIKTCQVIVNALFYDENKYISDKNNINPEIKAHYGVTDTTELRLIASRKTFY